MILRSGKTLRLNKSLIFALILSLWTAYAVSPVSVGTASASSGPGDIKNGPNLFFGEIICKDLFPRDKTRRVVFFYNKKRARKEEDPLNAPELEGGPVQKGAVSQWRTFPIKRATVCSNPDARRNLYSFHPIHSPPAA